VLLLLPLLLLLLLLLLLHFLLLLLLQAVIERVRETGYLQTMSGRRRWLPHINSRDWNKRGHAERVAVNGTVQGSAADLVKGAMVQLLADLRQEGLSQHCKMMVQVCG
jgi:DNA polymerase-1